MVNPQELRQRLTHHLRAARSTTDALFDLVRPEAIYERPVDERHRNIFYLGHFEAFDWNLLAGPAFGVEPFNAGFDRLFAFGIDPVEGSLPQDRAADWPGIDEVHDYNRRTRQIIDDLLQRTTFSGDEPLLKNGLAFWVAIEHRLMHAETFAGMMDWLPYDLKQPNPVATFPSPPLRNRRVVDIPAGEATLGLLPDERTPFGWDNEFAPQIVQVPPFSMDVYNVTNRDFLQFVNERGYQEPSFWGSSWEWIRKTGKSHPKFWSRRGDNWFCRAMFGDIPLPMDWAVCVTHAEASAYARWLGKALPTEAQYHRAAFGSLDGSERLYPWGDAPPSEQFGNFDFKYWTPLPVGSFPQGDSAFGIADLMGNGWEWTSTVFHPFPGFEAFSFYPGYSAEFFDGNHYVLKGAACRTASLLVRRSFRNFFQPTFPAVHATFRCVES